MGASENDLVRFVHDWVALCADGNVNEAFSLLDKPLSRSNQHWNSDDLKEVTFDHFDDGKYPEITSPDDVVEEIQNEVYEFDDGSGWSVDYKLPLNGVVSDFTLQFKFIIRKGNLKVILDDCHVL